MRVALRAVFLVNGDPTFSPMMHVMQARVAHDVTAWVEVGEGNAPPPL